MTRSLRRTSLTVFLVVFLGGLGVSGAAALWSAQAMLTATVPTGTWGRQAGWPWEAQVTVVRVRDLGDRYVSITWPDAPASTPGARTTYHATMSGTDSTVQSAGPLTTPGYEFRIDKNESSIVYTVTVTATVDGVASAPVSRSFRVHPNGEILPPTP